MEGVGTVKDAVTVELPEGTGTELTYAEMEIPHEAFPAAASYILDRQPIPTEHRMLAVTTDEGTVLIPAGVGNEFTYAELEIPHEAFPKPQ